MNQTDYQHLMNRAGFGATPVDIRTCDKRTRNEVVDQLFADSAETEAIATIKKTEVDEIVMGLKDGDADTKKMYRKLRSEKDRDLNTAWLRRMMSTNAPLAEKMTFFWHGHFACREDNPLLAQSLNNDIRSNALGNFRKLLVAVAQSPAMLNFLNNKQNKKDAPNENFAREVMELFTLGRGNYTEHDIKEAARAFTGWSFDKDTQQFDFKEKQHDFGEKEFFGKKGNFEGKDIIDMILYKEECARFIAGKIYQYFVNDTRDEKLIDELGHRFYMSDYDIGGLMRGIFTADWFYDKKNIGSHIKSPIELIVNTGRWLGAEYGGEDALVYVQRILGQVLFLPPNVAGWPVGKRWIDSSSLVFRMDFGRKLIEVSEFDQRLKADDDVDPNMTIVKEKMAKKGKMFELDAKIDWDGLNKQFSASNDVQLFNQISDSLLVNSNVNFADAGYTLKDGDSKARLQGMITYLMSRPEFQLS